MMKICPNFKADLIESLNLFGTCHWPFKACTIGADPGILKRGAPCCKIFDMKVTLKQSLI